MARLRGGARQLVDGTIRGNLVWKISKLTELCTAVERGEPTFEDFAAALISCADPDDALPCRYAACHPRRKPGEKLSDAVARADLAFLAACAHSCQPGTAGSFWAVYGLHTLSERSTHTGRPGVRGRLQRPLRESEETAGARYSALLTDLLSWAKAQSTTSTPRPSPARAAGPSAAARAAPPAGPAAARLPRPLLR